MVENISDSSSDTCAAEDEVEFVGLPSLVEEEGDSRWGINFDSAASSAGVSGFDLCGQGAAASSFDFVAPPFHE